MPLRIRGGTGHDDAPETELHQMRSRLTAGIRLLEIGKQKESLLRTTRKSKGRAASWKNPSMRPSNRSSVVIEQVRRV
jgi:hypothetical protein